MAAGDEWVPGLWCPRLLSSAWLSTGPLSLSPEAAADMHTVVLEP